MSTHLPLADTRLQPASPDEARSREKIFENSQIIFENEDTCLKANLHVREDLPALGWLDVESAADLEEVQTVSERDWSDKRYIAMVMCG